MYRLYEILPAALAWGTIAAIAIAAWRLPAWATVFIILFDVYWLFKTIYLSLHLRATFQKMRQNMKINWLERLEQMANGRWQTADGEGTTRSHTPYAIRHWRDIYHLVILPTAGEPYEVVRGSIESFARANYPKDRLIAVLAREARIPASAEVAGRIEAEFGKDFFRFFGLFLLFLY